MADVAIHPPRQNPTPPPQCPSLSLDTTKFDNTPIPNKHLPYCSPGPAPSSRHVPATPPASPPTKHPSLQTLSLLHPPDPYIKLSTSPPVFSIDPAALSASITHLASQEFPEPKHVFPWLHGLHPENHIQLGFFTARKKALMNPPKCFRGLTIVKAGGNMDKSKLKGALAPDEILCQERFADDTFVDMDPKDGFSVRNFQIQATKLATVSDIVVYRDDCVSEKELQKLAKRISRAQNTWKVKSTSGDQEAPNYNVFTLSCMNTLFERQLFRLTFQGPFKEIANRHPELVAIDSNGQTQGESFDFCKFTHRLIV